MITLASHSVITHATYSMNKIPKDFDKTYITDRERES